MKIPEPIRCHFKVVINRKLVNCDEVAVVRRHSESVTPLCKTHGAYAAGLGIKLVPIETEERRLG